MVNTLILNLKQRVSILQETNNELMIAHQDAKSSPRQKWKEYLNLLTVCELELNRVEQQFSSMNTLENITEVVIKEGKTIEKAISELKSEGIFDCEHPSLSRTDYMSDPRVLNYLGVSKMSDNGGHMIGDMYGNALLDTTSNIHHSAQRRPKQNPMPPSLSPVTPDEWNTLPFHLQSRLNLSRVNQAIDDINRLLAMKYRILTSSKKLLNNEETILYKKFTDAETDESRNLFWFSKENIRMFDDLSFRLDQTGTQILNLLRYTNRLKSVGGSRNLRYCLPVNF